MEGYLFVKYSPKSLVSPSRKYCLVSNEKIVGIFFSPEFGQSYYEMFYIGNCDGMVHFGAWHNRVDLRNYITVDLHLGKRALRLGYRQVMRTTHVNHIDTQVFTHAFVLGISGEIFRSVRPARRIVSVYH